MPNLRTPDQFKTRPARLLMGAIGLVLACLLITRAFDTGSWWQYFGTLFLIALSSRLIVRGIKNRS